MLPMLKYSVIGSQSQLLNSAPNSMSKTRIDSIRSLPHERLVTVCLKAQLGYHICYQMVDTCAESLYQMES
jgi:hypothetical protein